MTRRQIQKLIKGIYTQMQIKELLPAEEYQIFIKPNFNSATWNFNKGKHRIIIGEDIIKSIDKHTDEKAKAVYYKSYLYHELAHSIWTDRDLKAVGKMLREECISFTLFNLFEDARIEEKMRKHMKQRFGWTQYETLILPMDAVEIFFYILQSEHQEEALKYLKTNIVTELKPLLNSVFKYYKRVLQANDIHELIPIMLEWYEEFPQTDIYLEPFTHQNKLFVIEGRYGLDDEAFEELIKNLDDVLSENETLNIILDPLSIQNRESIQGKGLSLLSQEEQSINISPTEEKMLYDKIAALFDMQVHSRYTSSMLPAKRLNIRGIMQGSKRHYKKKEVLKNERSIPGITLIVDMSGSMLDIIDNMHMTLRVINRLASKGIIKCEMILSAVVEKHSQFQTIKLPVNDSVINKVNPCYAGEGIDYTMKSNIDRLKKSDYVWVLTDGCITSDAIDKKYFNQFGIKTHAFYIGSLMYTQTMQQYFDHVICQDDAQGLIDEILTLIR